MPYTLRRPSTRGSDIVSESGESERSVSGKRFGISGMKRLFSSGGGRREKK